MSQASSTAVTGPITFASTETAARPDYLPAVLGLIVVALLGFLLFNRRK